MSHSLEPLIRPKSIAVVGASSNPAKLGYVLLKNVIDYGFGGRIFPFNPAGGQILGLPVLKSLDELDHPADLVLISIPGQQVLKVLQDAGRTGCKCAVVLSSGFAEAGKEGQEAQAAIEKICLETGMRVLGPNCMGIYNNTDNLNGTYFWELPRVQGSVSFISQSGAFGGVMFSEIRAREMGVSKFFSIGNQVDISHADLLEALYDDENTKVVGLFIEAIKDSPRFLSALSRIAATRPVVAFKGGRSDAGVRAAASHTGSLAGSYQVYKAALEETGAIIAEDSEAFFDALMALSQQQPPRCSRVAIMTISGGPSVVAGDVCEELGIGVPRFTYELQIKLRKLIPPFGATTNPVDMTPQMNVRNFSACADAVLSQKSIGGAIAINVGLDKPEFSQAFITAGQKYDKPIVSFTIDTPQITRAFKEASVPVYPTPERAVRAYKALLDFVLRYPSAKYQRKIILKPKSLTLQQYCADNPELKIVPEAIAKKALSEYSVPVVDEQVVKIWSSTLRAAQDLGYPLALKVHSAELAHKTEIGGVILNIENEEQLRQAWKALNREFPSDDLLVQRLVPPGLEVIIGAKRDQTFGPVVAVGMGGVFVEIFGDIAVGVCPLIKSQALRMMRSLKGYKLLEGYRNQPGGNENVLAEVMMCVSEFMLANPEVLELDINPLIANGKSLVAVDALIKLSETSLPLPEVEISS